MVLTLLQSLLDREETFMEEETKKIRSHMSLTYSLTNGDNEMIFVVPLEVVTLNSSTGDSKDSSIQTAVEAYGEGFRE